MINNNNNFYGIDSMSASVYYGDGSYLTGVSGGGSASITISNSIIAPSVLTTGGALPWYKTNVPTVSYSTATFAVTLGILYFSPTTLLNGEVLNEVAVYCSLGVAGATASIGLYSVSLDGNGRYYPSTLVTNFGSVSLATTGRKVITGLNYTIPTVTLLGKTSNIFYLCILNTGTTGPSILGPANTVGVVYYNAMDAGTMNRPMTTYSGSGITSFPSTITSATWAAYTNQTTLPFIGFR